LLFSTPTMGGQWDVGHPWTWKQVFNRQQIYYSFIVDFPTSRIVRKKFLFSNLPGLCYSVIVTVLCYEIRQIPPRKHMDGFYGRNEYIFELYLYYFYLCLNSGYFIMYRANFSVLENWISHPYFQMFLFIQGQVN
jgi:hypothetical protein